MSFCVKCNTEKPSDAFYKHQLGKTDKGECKECTKKRVRENRAANAEYYKAFDRARANLPHRVQARKEYAQTPQGKQKITEIKKNYQKNHPSRRKAVNAVNNAVRDGQLIKPKNCQCCGIEAKRIEGHHCDYNKPLDVMWLCDPCHKEWHRNNTPIYANIAFAIA